MRSGSCNSLVLRVTIATLCKVRKLTTIFLATCLLFCGTESRASDGDLTIPVKIGVDHLLSISLPGNVISYIYVSNFSLDAITQPIHGTLSFSGTTSLAQLTYRPSVGFVGSDEFVAFISNDGVRRAVRYLVTIQNDPTVPVNPGLPVPKNVVRVSNVGQLTVALAAAKPGDQILLADGIYSGFFNATRAGTITDPVVIRAANPLGAKLRGSVSLNAANVWLWGVWLDGAPVGITGDGDRMSRCRQNDTSGIAILVGRGDGVQIDHNELYGMRDRGISLKPDPATPTALRNVHIDHNWLHDWVGVAGTNVHEGMQIGQTASNTDISLKSLVEYNLFEKVGVDPEAISIKSSDNIVRYNTVLNSTAAIENRHGERNEISGNWIENSQGIRVHDRGHRILGNRLVGTDGLRIMAGDLTADQWPLSDMSGSHWPAAENVLVAGNTANKIEIGSMYSTPWTTPARNIRLEGNVGTVSLKLQVGLTQAQVPSVTIPTARKLTRAEVGPNAS